MIKRPLLLAIAFALLEWLAHASVASAQSGLEALHATRERPLFSPTRRPPPPPAPPPAPIAPAVQNLEPPHFILSGILLGDQTAIVLLRRPTEPKPKPFAPGEKLDGWRITQVEERRILLTRGGQKAWLEMVAPAH